LVDFERGDTVCTGCGLVQSERNRESGPNIRLFADDSDKKNQDKIHWAPLSRYDELAYKSTRVTVTEVVGNAGAMTQTRFKKMVAEPRDDTDFLEDGFGCIKEGMEHSGSGAFVFVVHY
jgi:transcription initiation factor TFIIIB Brf1 subunit/transcription initiation factor TFIIB